MPQKQQRAIHFDENVFRAQLAQDGDSVIVIVDDPMIKVHVHSKCPGDVLNLATQYGELNQIHILNMRDQHREIMRLAEENPVDSVQATSYTGQIADDGQLSSSDVGAYKHYGMIAVAAGQGIADIFTSLGIDCVLSGGQTMNPSTEEIVNAILKVNSEHVFIFPNNSNIILAAEQAKRLVDKSIVVIPTVSIPQGIAAALALQVDGSLEQNIEAMKTALHGVRSGQVTCAVRDSSMEGLRIEENDYIGMLDQKIIVSHPDVLETCISLLAAMIIEGDEVLTIMTGAEAEALQTSLLVEHLEHSFPDVEVEVLSGGQPLYSYLFSVE